MPETMLPLTIVCQRIVEEKFGLGYFKPEWKQGHDALGEKPILWTTIECKSCQGQVYFDKKTKKHCCIKCGANFD